MQYPRVSAFALAACLSPALPVLAQVIEVRLGAIPPAVSRQVDFKTEVFPIFKSACFKCHGAEKQKGKYRMDTREGAFKVTEDHGPSISPGKSAESAIILMAAGQIEEMLMPPPGGKPGESDPLSAEQIGILRAWIDQGATWPDGPVDDVVKPVTFEADVKPLFMAACAKCHSGASAEGGFSVETEATVLGGGKGYGKVVTPGDTKKSSLLTIISGQDEDIPKPEAHKLQPTQVETIREWIGQGAK